MPYDIPPWLWVFDQVIEPFLIALLLIGHATWLELRRERQVKTFEICPKCGFEAEIG